MIGSNSSRIARGTGCDGGFGVGAIDDSKPWVIVGSSVEGSRLRTSGLVMGVGT
jgi:hypothetical protein